MQTNFDKVRSNSQGRPLHTDENPIAPVSFFSVRQICARIIDRTADAETRADVRQIMKLTTELEARS